MKKTNTPRLLYIIQDDNRECCGVCSTLPLARDVFIETLSQTVTAEGFESFIEHQGSPNWDAKIIVCELDGNYVWSYDSLEEIDEAIANGEKYED